MSIRHGLAETEPYTVRRAESRPAHPSGRRCPVRRHTRIRAAQLALATGSQIGDVLFISEKTVSVHVTNLLRKLGVRSRTEAADMRRRLG